MKIHTQKVKDCLSGNIERVTYFNNLNGFCVLQIKAKKCNDLVTVIGNVSSPVTIGEYIRCSGIWYNDHRHGLQFKSDSIEVLLPQTLESLEKYLASGLIKGIGAYYAKKLVSIFKDKVFEVIDCNPELLSTVGGIGKLRAQSIYVSWQNQKVLREIIAFLQFYEIKTTNATKIYKTYGKKAVQVLSENPYKLAEDIKGIGFASADAIANRLGIAKNSLIRVRAGIKHVLLEATLDGHCGLPQNLLIKGVSKLLEIEINIVQNTLKTELMTERLIVDHLNGIDTIFLRSYYYYEKSIAILLLNLSKAHPIWNVESIYENISLIKEEYNICLAESQRLAVSLALKNKVTVISGGPGTGKTTIINILLKILKTKNLKIKLCAPTGRAARRLSETTGLLATTVHRLLEFDPVSGRFKKNEESPLLCDYLVIDETSMIDVSLFYSLLKAISASSGLLLVGDADQLSSIGAGQVLKDIIQANIIPTIHLAEIFRQEVTSHIITNAHLVNKGVMPCFQNNVKKESDFYFIDAEQGENIINKIVFLIKEIIPEKLKLDSIYDIQVLCPMQRGSSGARSLNAELQKILNPGYYHGITKLGQVFAVGDKIMQTENNYDKETYNGDTGIIKSINEENHEVIINFYNRDVIYSYMDLDQITLAYAITIHKSQGSEYPVVIIPVTMQSYIMLKRNLIYTAVTRGKKLVIIVGQKSALALAIKNNNNSNRYTKLRDWLVVLN